MSQDDLKAFREAIESRAEKLLSSFSQDDKSPAAKRIRQIHSQIFWHHQKVWEKYDLDHIEETCLAHFELSNKTLDDYEKEFPEVLGI